MKKPNHTSTPNRIAVCREYAMLWQRYFNFFSDPLADKVITNEMEMEFAQIVSLLALNQYKFQELVGDDMPDADKIVAVLSETMSLNDLKTLQESTYSKLQLDWHTLFISMNKALGRLSSRLTPKELAMMQQGQAQQG
ncbi:MAG: hypothetical protein SF028_10875 [Candidatus Sumerlaeia bacterium]|nr:hypothetical protein [Candidatus Sumerlaeia bacterium]